MPLDAVTDGSLSGKSAIGKCALSLGRPDVELPGGFVVGEIVGGNPIMIVFRFALRPNDVLSGSEVRTLGAVGAIVFDCNLGQLSRS